MCQLLLEYSAKKEGGSPSGKGKFFGNGSWGWRDGPPAGASRQGSERNANLVPMRQTWSAKVV
jgi:hypothetical protein